jgi:O-acetyl-ADP-ribose deacetylase (regulator of RNase III)
MIELTTGDLLKANAEALVNTVNCDGFMGRGIAAQFKRVFPANFRA